MSARRFTDKPELRPHAVMALPDDHAAMTENRTLFPSTVVTVTGEKPERLLVPGRNNRNIGDTVEKGRFRGYAIVCLTLEERATCPVDCDARAICYGNAMQLARRHRVGDIDVFLDRLGFEIVEMLDEHPGLLVRLHVLGDFFSEAYVAFWREVLDEYPNVACYGYTHRAPAAWGGDEIGDAIQEVKDAHPDRFRIRWSAPVARADGAVIVDAIPAGPRAGDGSIVCPAQVDATACCATCGLCWEPAAARECIAFVRHGRHTADAEAKTAMADAPAAPAPDGGGELRQVAAITIDGVVPAAPGAPPLFEWVDPADLIVETRYQRELSAKSIRLIRRVVEGFDWAKYKPPVCVAVGGRYFVIDGQHTAIAAATHPGITKIPVMVVEAASMEARAASFVAQNRDRVTMTAAQIFFGDVAAGDADSRAILAAVEAAGAHVPRGPVARQAARVGQVVSIGRLQRFFRAQGAERLREALEICVLAGCRPITGSVFEAVCGLLTEPEFSGVSRSAIAAALAALRDDFDQAVIRLAAELDSTRFHAARVLLYREASARAGRRAA